MAFSIKTKQVAGVTLIVGVAVVLLSAWYISTLADLLLAQTHANAEVLAKQIYHRSFDVIREGVDDPVLALQEDGGLRSILQGSIYPGTFSYAAVVDPNGRTLLHNLQSGRVDQSSPAADDLTALMALNPIEKMRAIFFDGDRGGRQFEFRYPLVLGDRDFGAVRVGVSTLVLRGAVAEQMRAPLITAAVAILLASLVAMLLAQLVLRPIHVIRSGLARLGRGELDVNVDLSGDAEMTELGDSFRAVSAQIAASRSEVAGQRATLEGVVEHLEDAMALFSPDGTLLFANPAMQPALPHAEGTVATLFPSAHPYRRAVEAVLDSRESFSPRATEVPEGGERIVLAHPFEDPQGEFLGVMLVARNLTYLAEVESTLNYSRKLGALGRLSAGIAHEVKNPLNATMIHLELLRMRLADRPEALDHVAVITAQMRRLDEVVQGFLKFTRPEDLRLQPVSLGPLLNEIRPIIDAEATPRQIEVRIELPANLPPVDADSGLLQQAFLNLALNACQAMPQGGRLRISAAQTETQRVQVSFEDTGVGIPPEHLERIFDLYFTTREGGSGIGLSLVYRTIQLHDGEIEVQSTAGRGTTFRVVLREATRPARRARPSDILGLHDVPNTGVEGRVSAS